MTRRQRLSETQIAELFDPPTEQRELVRHYTLSETDLAAIAALPRRSQPPRLRAHALLSALSRPGLARRRAAACGAARICRRTDRRVPSGSIDEYLATTRNRGATPSSARSQLGLRPSANRPRRN